MPSNNIGQFYPSIYQSAFTMYTYCSATRSKAAPLYNQSVSRHMWCTHTTPHSRTTKMPYGNDHDFLLKDFFYPSVFLTKCNAVEQGNLFGFFVPRIQFDFPSASPFIRGPKLNKNQPNSTLFAEVNDG